MSTIKGFAKLTFNQDSTIKVTIHRREEGIYSDAFLPRSCDKLSDGSMVFGGNKGFYMFHPDDVINDTLKPTVIFLNLKIANTLVKVGQSVNGHVLLKKSIADSKHLTINHKNNSFSIEFAGLQYNLPEYNKYAYRLEGYDTVEWNYTTATKREVEYMNLPGGDYILRVKAANSYGYWAEPISLEIQILPPWWRTWWFRISLFIAVIACFISFYRYRVNALKRQKRILEQKVAERTLELREASSQLEEKQEEILQQNEELITKNDEIQQQKEELVVKNEEIESSKQKLEKAFNNITLLSEFGQKLTSTFDFDAINKMIYEYVSSLMDTSAFGIGIYNEKRKVIDFPYYMENGEPLPYFHKSLTNEKSLSVRCFSNKTEIIINDLPAEYKKYLEELPDVQTSNLPSSIIYIPLTIENKSIGTITVNSFKRNAYNENDVANLRTLASYISIALDNSKAYRIIRSKNEQINGSIRYGQTIQKAMLPPKEQINKYFENFIIFRPKDIVSGDFYWFATVETLHATSLRDGKPMYLLAVVDCTGHGVPGAFMSMIGSRLLNDIVVERKIYSPAKILEQLNIMVRKALRQDNTNNHDGMDVCLCRFQQMDVGWELTYAGAKRPLMYFNSASKTIEEIPGTRRSIGGFTGRKNIFDFAEMKYNINPDDTFYLSTDGLADQCSPQKNKFSQKRLIDLIQSIHTLPLLVQKERLEKDLDQFQDGYEQRDDITLVGVKLL